MGAALSEAVEEAIERLFDEIAPLAELRGYQRQRIKEDVRRIIAVIGTVDYDLDWLGEDEQ